MLLACLAGALPSLQNKFLRNPSDGQGKWLYYLLPDDAESHSVSALPESLPGASQMALGRKIDLNTATAADLEAMPGIGPKMAERIVQDRSDKGPYVSLESLMRVKGIKEKKLAQMRPYLAIGRK